MQSIDVLEIHVYNLVDSSSDLSILQHMDLHNNHFYSSKDFNYQDDRKVIHNLHNAHMDNSQDELYMVHSSLGLWERPPYLLLAVEFRVNSIPFSQPIKL